MPPQTLQEQLVKYLADAHALEEQALQQLDKARRIAGDDEIARIYDRHLRETEAHERLIRQRLEAHGEKPSKVKDMAMKAGALGTGMAAQSAPDTPSKLAAHAFAFEHFEIASYRMLEAVAKRADDPETAAIAEQIRRQEEETAEKIAGIFERAVARGLEKQGVTA